MKLVISKLHYWKSLALNVTSTNLFLKFIVIVICFITYNEKHIVSKNFSVYNKCSSHENAVMIVHMCCCCSQGTTKKYLALLCLFTLFLNVKNKLSIESNKAHNYWSSHILSTVLGLHKPCWNIKLI